MRDAGTFRSGEGAEGRPSGMAGARVAAIALRITALLIFLLGLVLLFA